jgi:DNA repair protein RecO (recombination protein O)
MLTTLQAIVLRPTPFQEGGLVVSFLTEHGERITGLAKGAKKPSAKWVSAFEPLSLVKVAFFGKEQSEIRRITRCELVQSPLALGHLEASLAMACLADCFDRVAKEGVEDARLYRLLSACGRALKADPDRAFAILAWAEHWLLHCLGLLPSARACGRCGDADADFAALSEEWGWLCGRCAGLEPREALPPGAKARLAALRAAAAEAAPPLDTPAARAVADLLRGRLLKELGDLGSYRVLHRMAP